MNTFFSDGLEIDLYDYKKITGGNPSMVWSCCNYILVEHPFMGDEAPLVGICPALGLAWCTSFDDPVGDDGDMSFIEEQYQALKRGHQ